MKDLTLFTLQAQRLGKSFEYCFERLMPDQVSRANVLRRPLTTALARPKPGGQKTDIAGRCNPRWMHGRAPPAH